MATLNVSNLEAIVQGLTTQLSQLATKSAVNQTAVDTLTQLATSLQNSVVAIINTPDPGPRTDLDFTALDNAVLAFKENTKISQNDANNVAGLIGLNTPK